MSNREQIENLDPPTICDNCIHDEVCGLEGHLEPAMTYCDWKEEKRLKGEWIICNQDLEGIHKIQCPFCNYYKGSDFGGLITLTFDRFPPFCENCGADLRGGRE